MQGNIFKSYYGFTQLYRINILITAYPSLEKYYAQLATKVGSVSSWIEPWIQLEMCVGGESGARPPSQCAGPLVLEGPEVISVDLLHSTSWSISATPLSGEVPHLVLSTVRSQNKEV